MSSHSSDCAEVFPNVEESSSSVDLEHLVHELSPVSSEHVMPSSGRGIYIPELGRRISIINQLTRQQHASLSEGQLLRVVSFMANFPSEMRATLSHRGGRRQPAEDESSSSDHNGARPSGAEQDTLLEVRNAPAGPSLPDQPVEGGRRKARIQRGRARGRRAREEGGDPVHGRDDAARPISQFEVDRHPSRMTKRELDMIRQLYNVPDYMDFRLPEPSDQPTRPPPGCTAIYRDYFIKWLRLPLHPFMREALLNLDVSLPQLNQNAVQSLVVLWVLYRLNHFPDLTVEEFQAAYAMKNSPNCNDSYYF